MTFVFCNKGKCVWNKDVPVVGKTCTKGSVDLSSNRICMSYQPKEDDGGKNERKSSQKITTGS